MILTPYGLNFEDVDYQALSIAAKHMNDREVIITDIETIPPHQCTVVIPWERAVLEQIRSNTILGHVECGLFGQSGTWGALCNTDDYCCLGGKHNFMNVFLAEAGGFSALRERFYRFAQSEWHLDSVVRRQVLKKVGWFDES